MIKTTVQEITRPQIGSRVRVIGAATNPHVGRVGYVYDVRSDGTCHVADGDIDGPENGRTWMTWTPSATLEVLPPQRDGAL